MIHFRAREGPKKRKAEGGSCSVGGAGGGAPPIPREKVRSTHGGDVTCRGGREQGPGRRGQKHGRRTNPHPMNQLL